jgi:hypothetical protein
MKKLRKNTLLKSLKSLVKRKGICKFTTITTDLKFRLYGFYNSLFSITYIRAAEGLLHKSRGLSLFHAPFGLLILHTEGFTSYFLTSNNDK